MEIKCDKCLHSCVCSIKQTYMATANSMEKLLDEGSDFNIQLNCRFYKQEPTPPSACTYTVRSGINNSVMLQNPDTLQMIKGEL